MKKNGFTLIELIAIIVIISVILLVSMPSLLKTLQNTENKQYNDYLNNLYIATETYITNNEEYLSKLDTDGKYVEIYIRELVEAGYFNVNDLDTDVIDININSRVRVTVNRNTKRYVYNFYK